MQCCALVLATCRKHQTPQLWMEGTGEGCGFFCSPKLPYLRTMSQQFCRRLQVFNRRLKLSAVVTETRNQPTTQNTWEQNTNYYCISRQGALRRALNWTDRLCILFDSRLCITQAFLKLSQTLTSYELAENAVNNSEQHVTPVGLLGLIFVWHVPLASQSCYTFCGQL